MAATVTTPTAVPGTVSTAVVPSVTIDSAFVDAMHLVFTRITTPGVKHLVIPPPMSRWDGTVWVPTYSPKA